MRTALATMLRLNTSRWLVAALLVAAATVASTPALAIAITYKLDNGVISGTFGVDGSYANEFTITNMPGQVIATVLLKQCPDLAGKCDVTIWDDTGAAGTPGNVIGSVNGLTLPQGTAWSVIDLSAQNIAVAPGAHIFVGFVREYAPDVNALPAQFDEASSQTATFWKAKDGVWTQWGGGYLLARVLTSVPPNPTEPTNVTLTPTNATLGDRLKATAAGSINPDPTNPMSYQYQWAKSTGAAPWGDWVDGTPTIAPDQLVAGDRWKARARAAVTGYESAWVESTPVFVRNVVFRAIPANGATNVQRQGFLQLNFQWPMVQSTIESGFTLTPAGSTTPVAGTFEWKKIGLILRFHPTTPLAQNTVFTLKLPKGIVRRGPMPVQVDTVVTFTTGYMPIPITWLPQGTGAPVTSKIVCTFDKPMDPLTFTPDNFKILPSVAGTVAVVDKKLTFTPTAPLAANTTYNVWLSGQIATTTGRIMGRSFAWNFKTAAAAAPALIATANATTTGSGATQITVNLTSAATVSADITNIAGQVIATLPPRAFDAGVATLLWDGRSARGTKVPAGRYFTRVVAASSTGEQVHVQAAFDRN